MNVKIWRAALTTCAAAAVSVALMTSAHAEPSAAKKELINKVIQLQQGGIDGTARLVVEQPAAALWQRAAMVIQTRVAPEKREALAKEIQADIRKYLDEVNPVAHDKATKVAPGVLTPLLDEKFNEDELKQLISWLESPVVKRYLQLSPEIQKGLADKLVGEIRGQVEPKVQALERTIGGKLGIPAPDGKASGAAPAKKK